MHLQGRARRIMRLAMAAIAGVGAVVLVLRLERQRPITELERAGASVMQDPDGTVRAVSFCSPNAGDDHLSLIAQLTSVASVNLSRSQVTADGLRRLSALPKLHTLDLSETPQCQQALAALANFPALKTLHLRHCEWLNDEALRPLEHLRSLDCLLISEADLTDAGLERLARLPQLKFLAVDRCGKLTDAESAGPGMHGWSRCPSMTASI
ncbi:MAG: hypothetical protein U0992_07395 [Planctomycetaceae bacterium]